MTKTKLCIQIDTDIQYLNFCVALPQPDYHLARARRYFDIGSGLQENLN